MGNNRSKLERKKLVWKKTGNICAHCGKNKTGNKRTIDHFIPKSKGGTYDLRNLIPLCEDCNKIRGNMPIDPFEFYIFAPKKVLYDCVSYKREWTKFYKI